MTKRAAAEARALEMLDDLLNRALKGGADAADAVMVESRSLGASYRQGKPEDIERSESFDVGLRCMVGKRQAVVSSTDMKLDMMDELATRGIAMAKASPEDPWCGIANPGQIATDLPDLDLHDPSVPEVESLIESARIAEEAALAVGGVKQSEGASAGYGAGCVALAIRGDGVRFGAAYSTSSFSLSCSVIAEDADGHMERDYDFSSVRHLSALEDAATVGRTAAEKTVKRVGARKMPSGKVPVVFDPRVASSLVGHLAGAINGSSVARGSSFLKDRMGQQIFASGIRIIDDPLRQRGMRSRAVDGEGIAGREMALVDDGHLQTWILDCASARQLGLETTGHASRGTGGPPSPGTSNLYLAAGDIAAAELIRNVGTGFYVTELIGFGVNGVTGDYSRGAAGFWIEDGEIAFPVSEMTIAGNLKDMFMHLTPANDLTFRYGTNAPTLVVEGMTVAGN
ncbi:MAG: metallopeptidase TldD-related protein [Minwuia sp.]|nr:metallopeptidase TldD-related protein [Minwuia sp.]